MKPSEIYLLILLVDVIYGSYFLFYLTNVFWYHWKLLFKIIFPRTSLIFEKQIKRIYIPNDPRISAKWGSTLEFLMTSYLHTLSLTLMSRKEAHWFFFKFLFLFIMYFLQKINLLREKNKNKVENGKKKGTKKRGEKKGKWEKKAKKRKVALFYFSVLFVARIILFLWFIIFLLVLSYILKLREKW